MSVPITIHLPKSTIDAIRESAGINSNIRAVAHATAVTMPAVIAAVNNIPADVVAAPVATPAVAVKREATADPQIADKRKKRTLDSSPNQHVVHESPQAAPPKPSGGNMFDSLLSGFGCVPAPVRNPVDDMAGAYGSTFEILIRNMEGLTHAIDVDNKMPIDDLRKEYNRRSGLPIFMTILLHYGERLRDGTVGDYELEEGAVIEAHREEAGS